MNGPDSPRDDSPPSGGFWRSRAGKVLVGFAVIGGLLLVYEHRLHLFTGDGLLLVLLVLWFGLHFFMHGGHGGHGGHGNHGGHGGGERGGRGNKEDRP